MRPIVRSRTSVVNRSIAELLIDCEEDRVLRAVLVGMLRDGALVRAAQPVGKGWQSDEEGDSHGDQDVPRNRYPLRRAEHVVRLRPSVRVEEHRRQQHTTELLMDYEEDRTLRAVLVGMLREGDSKRWHRRDVRFPPEATSRSDSKLLTGMGFASSATIPC
jgi:hypothetical protein